MNKIPGSTPLRHLVALHDHHHFGRAAEACFISQSTLSASIANLESLLECALLERKHKSFVFTPLGAEIVRQARSILQALEEMAMTARNNAKPMHGTLRLGCIPTIAPFLVHNLLSACRMRYPDLTLLIREDTSDHAIHLLQGGKLDMVILALPWPATAFHTRILHRDPFCMVLPPHLEKADFGCDLSRLPDGSIYLLEKEHCLTAHSLKACQLRDTSKINPFFATSLHTLTSLVDAVSGITFLPKLAIDHGILKGTNLVARRLPGKAACREIGALWRETSSRQQSLEILATLVSDLLKGQACKQPEESLP